MSKLEVDKIDPQSGTALEIGSSGDTVTIPSGVTLDASNATTTLPATVVTTTGTQTLTNKSIAATQLTGTITPSDGTVTNAKIVDSTIALGKLSATGTKDATTFLRGDNTFAEAGGGAFELISTTTVTTDVASVDFDTLSTDYKDFKIIASAVKNATHQKDPQIRVKRSGQSSFDSGSSDYLWNTYGFRDANNVISNYNTSSNMIRLTGTNCASESGVSGASNNFEIDFYNVHGTNNKKFVRSFSAFTDGTYGRSAHAMGSGYRNNQEALIGLQFFFSSGNIDEGFFSLYGRKI